MDDGQFSEQNETPNMTIHWSLSAFANFIGAARLPSVCEALSTRRGAALRNRLIRPEELLSHGISDSKCELSDKSAQTPSRSGRKRHIIIRCECIVLGITTTSLLKY